LGAKPPYFILEPSTPLRVTRIGRLPFDYAQGDEDWTSPFDYAQGDGTTR